MISYARLSGRLMHWQLIFFLFKYNLEVQHRQYYLGVGRWESGIHGEGEEEGGGAGGYHTHQSRSKTWVGESVCYATPYSHLPYNAACATHPFQLMTGF